MSRSLLLAVAVLVGGSVIPFHSAEAQGTNSDYDRYQPATIEAPRMYRRPVRTYRRYVMPPYYSYPTQFSGPAFGGPLFRGPAFGGPFRGPAFGGPLFRGPAFSGPVYGPPGIYGGW